MRRLHSFLFLSFLLFAEGNLQAQSPAGTWKWSTDMQGQTINSVLHLEVDGEKVTGTYSDQNIEEKIEDGTLKDGKVSFNMITEVNGTDIYVEWEGQVGKDAIEGTVALEAGGQKMDGVEWKAKRYVGTSEVAGTWNFVFTAADGNEYKPVLTVVEKSGKLSAKFVGDDDEEVKVENLKLVDNTLTFDLTLDYNGSELDLTYNCKPRGNEITGTIDFSVGGNTGDFEIKASRKVLAKSLVPLLGSWDFTMVTPDGVTVTPVMTLSDNAGELAVKLVNDGESYELENVSVKDGELSFEFTTDHDGNEIDLTWKSKLAGKDAMKGTVEFDIGGESGVLESSGKRQ